jgi:hypothetical protein
MSPSPLASGRAALVGAVALSVVLLIAIPILNSHVAKDDRAEAVGPSPSASTPPSSTKKAPPDKRALQPIRLSDGSVRVDGHVLTPRSQAKAGGSDIRIFSPAYGRPWTGPWELDFSNLRVEHTPANVVFTLSFAELNIREGWRDDTFRIYVDFKENPPGPLAWPAMHPAAEREVDFNVVPRHVDGAVYPHRGDQFGAIRNCGFDATLHEVSASVTVKVPRRCFDYSDRLRARAEFQSRRYNGWEAWDPTEWTGYAELGGSAAIRDPARAWSQAP